jgi:hypothetical protein
MHPEPLGSATLTWRKSSASAGADECVEFARLNRTVLVRDSRDKSGPTLSFTSTEWQALLTRIQAAL